MSFVFALQAGSAIPTTVLELILTGTMATKVVLVVLVVLSLLSWGIMLAKSREFTKIEKAGAEFLRKFERAHSLADVISATGRMKPNAYTRVFDRAQQFLSDTKPALGATTDREARLSGSQVEALRLVLDSQTTSERQALGRYVPWLASIGSVSPLIGLLGTVLGVISAFIGVATKGAGNLGAVAPGVADALTATAAALAVAIPAVFGYNFFANRLNRFDGELEGFGSELIALMVREGRI
ncbi:MAG TPA: MotA/TolQ/ExbB proton channel family protein [Gemmatimonadaceae bacterium]|nr:MotA/TolQ/ExbB proton channel family protein [Gemmatimonadaceae bacterium]